MSLINMCSLLIICHLKIVTWKFLYMYTMYHEYIQPWHPPSNSLLVLSVHLPHYFVFFVAAAVVVDLLVLLLDNWVQCMHRCGVILRTWQSTRSNNPKEKWFFFLQQPPVANCPQLGLGPQGQNAGILNYFCFEFLKFHCFTASYFSLQSLPCTPSCSISK